MNAKRFAGYALAGLLAFSMAGCGEKPSPSSPAQSGSYKDTLNIGLDVEPETLDPRLARDISATRVFEQVCDSLVEVNEQLEPIPCLAESWENPDELTWIFKLRQGVKFHDGSDFDAEDVKHTFDTIRDPEFGAVYAANYASISEVVVEDPYTVKFILSEPYAPLLVYNMTLPIVPAEADDMEGFSEHPIGTGPYVFKEWSRNSKLTMEANPDYWGEKAKTQNLVFHIVPENATRVAALEAGDVDLVHTPLTPQDIQRLQQDPRFVVDTMSGLGIHQAAFNHNVELLKDKRVRMALAHLIDKETMAQELCQGIERPGVSVLLPTSWAWSDSVTGFPYDPEKAKALFKEAGWEDSDGDGILDKDGNKLTVTIYTYTQDDLKMQMAEYMQNTFTSAGVDAQVKIGEWPSFIDDVSKGNYEIAVFGMMNMIDPDKYLFTYLRSTSPSNWGGYSSAEFDSLVEQARKISDQSERAKLYQKAAQINNDEVMHDVMVYQGYVAIHSAKMEGFTPHPAGYWRSLRNATVQD
ncbi:MAG: ABC transporter substrate-binding protein [Clostridiales Family XIII bacterium]|nr:ABC transporter substrate-binding protein [Clostridiales Family XIII bacterium]